MKILINDKNKMLRFGLYVVAATTAGEFILDTDNCELSNPALFAICESNKIPVSKKAAKLDILEAIEEGIEKLNLPKADTKPPFVIVKEIVEKHMQDGGIDADEEDAVLLEIIQKGIKFKDAPKLFNQVMIEGGYRVSAKDRYESIKAILVKADFAPNNWSEVDAMITRVTKEVPDTEYSKAYSLIRKWNTEQKNADLPKPEKAISGGFRGKVLNWMYKNPLATQAQFNAYIVEDLEKEQKVADKYWQIFEVGQKIAQATIALAETETAE
jgi:hypothetical protein